MIKILICAFLVINIASAQSKVTVRGKASVVEYAGCRILYWTGNMPVEPGQPVDIDTSGKILSYRTPDTTQAMISVFLRNASGKWVRLGKSVPGKYGDNLDSLIARVQQ